MLPAFRLPLSPVLGNVEDYVRAKGAPIPRGSLSWPKMVNPRSALSQCPAPPSPCPTPPPIVMPGLVPGIQAPTARSCPGRTTTGAASTETSRAGPPRMTTQGTGCAQYQWQDCETNPIRRNALIPCPVRTHAAGEQERRPPPPSPCPDLFRASKRPRHGLVPTGVPFDDGSGLHGDEPRGTAAHGSIPLRGNASISARLGRRPSPADANPLAPPFVAFPSVAHDPIL